MRAGPPAVLAKRSGGAMAEDRPRRRDGGSRCRGLRVSVLRGLLGYVHRRPGQRHRHVDGTFGCHPRFHRAACSCWISGWLARWTPVTPHDVPCGAGLGPSLILEGMRWGPARVRWVDFAPSTLFQKLPFDQAATRAASKSARNPSSWTQVSDSQHWDCLRKFCATTALGKFRPLTALTASEIHRRPSPRDCLAKFRAPIATDKKRHLALSFFLLMGAGQRCRHLSS